MNDQGPVRHRHKPPESRALARWRKYRFELIWLIVVGLGLFLLFERMSIRESLSAWFNATAARLLGGLQQLDGNLDVLIERVSFSDVFGVLLIAGAVVAILLRLRWRLLSDPKLTTAACPKCGGPVHRVHRTTSDHLISAFVPVRRYRCSNDACRWRGLRVGKHHASANRRVAAPS